MATHATEIGDVLILGTSQAYTVYAVGSVCRVGQQDFGNTRNVQYFADYADAIRVAQTLVHAGGRIYFVDIDTGAWAAIAR